MVARSNLTDRTVPASSTDHRPLAVFRDADWLNGQRARGYGLILLTIMALIAMGWAGYAALHGGLDAIGKPVGVDYPSFWAASKLALQGKAAQAYDMAAHFQVQKDAFGGAPIGYSAFFYPPPYLLVCLPLALLAYTPSLIVWLTATGVMARQALRPLLDDRDSLLALAAFPAVLSNLAHGQNAFLTTALSAYGLTRIDKRPWLAGLVLGVLVIKPHLALVLPFALAATGRWRTFLATGFAAVALCAASWLVFGSEVWTGFLAASPIARAALEQNLVGDEKMQSAFAAIRLLGGPLWLGWAVQGITSLAAIATLTWAGGKTTDVLAQASLTACAALLASPFLLDYDLMLAALPLL